MDFWQKSALYGVADDGKARLLGQLPGQFGAFQDFRGGSFAAQVGVVHNAGDLLAAFGFDALHLGEGPFQIPGFRTVGIEHV